MKQPFTTAISKQIWQTRYRLVAHGDVKDKTIEDSWRRVAHAVAACEERRAHWEDEFFALLSGFDFLPGGRILANAGSGQGATLCNCFAMRRLTNDLNTIFHVLQDSAVTMTAGGGIGCDFSDLLPRGCNQANDQFAAPGPVAFLELWESMCRTVLSGSQRRGAMMATLRCDHPDIEGFIEAKSRKGRLSHFNLSVLVSDAFMQAVEKDQDWPLVYPRDRANEVDNQVEVCKSVNARALWHKLMEANFRNAEPGILFIDRINRRNNLGYCEHISTTNPCGELPLPDYGSCVLGSVNLTNFVLHAFTKQAEFDVARVQKIIATAVRFLDNTIDIAQYPLSAQRNRALSSRRIGLGITGLADTLIMLGKPYQSREARKCSENIMKAICFAAYRSSIARAREKKPFPLFDKDRYLAGQFIQTLPADLRSEIKTHGIRNSHLLAIAPAGTISLLANNVSNGVEPVYALKYTRRIRKSPDHISEISLEDYAWRRWRDLYGDTPLGEAFVTVGQISPTSQLKMQAVLQKYVDSAISKTINVPQSTEFADFCHVYEQAYKLGLKGCTTFKQGAIEKQVLNTTRKAE